MCTFRAHYFRMKLNRVTIHLTDHLYGIALKKAGEMGVERYLDHLIADSLLHDDATKKSMPEKNDVLGPPPGITPAVFINGDEPKTILQIHLVARHVWEDNMSFSKAVRITANEFNVEESTVRDKCTRRIKINTQNFEELLKMPAKLAQHLCQRFPDHRREIEEKFNPYIK